MGTNALKIKPFVNATIAAELPAYLVMMGNVVSMLVAPPGAIASYLPIYLAMRGTVRMLINSLKTFARKAMLPRSAPFTSVIMTADKEYQPNPADTASVSLSDRFIKNEATTPPESVPIIVPTGTKKANLSLFKRSKKALLSLPMSKPTMNSKSRRQYSVILDEFVHNAPETRDIWAETTPRTVEKNINIIIDFLFFSLTL